MTGQGRSGISRHKGAVVKRLGFIGTGGMGSGMACDVFSILSGRKDG